MSCMLYQNFKLVSGIVWIDHILPHSFTAILKDQFNYLFFLKIAERIIIFYEYRAIASRQRNGIPV